MKRRNAFLALCLCVFAFLALSPNLIAQITHPTSGTVSLEACEDFADGATYTDSGGANAPYSADETGTLELCAPCGETVSVTFNFFDLEAETAGTCWDVIVIVGDANGNDGTYGGDDNDGNLNCIDLTDDQGLPVLGGGSATFVSMPGSCLSFTFDSDGNINQGGWEAIVDISSCVAEEPVGGAVACNNQIQVSLDQQCSAEITPDMILEGTYSCFENFTVEIGGIIGTTVTTPGTYTVTITDELSGNSCWGNILVEDNLPPVVESCPCGPNGVPTSSVSGSIDPDDPTWNRTNNFGMTPGNCTPTAGGVESYDVFNFSIDKMDTYTFSMPSIVGPDFFFVLYEGGFDPTNPCNNVLASDDDSNGTEPEIMIQLTLVPGDYTLVITTFATDNDAGAYDFSITSTMGGMVLAEDPNCEFLCVEEGLLVNSDITTGILGLNPVLSDNCGNVGDLTFSDQWFEGEDCGEQLIVRSWFTTIVSHGVPTTTLVCVQHFTLNAATLDDVNPPMSPVILPCGSETSMAFIANFFDTNLNGPADDGYFYAFPHLIGSDGNAIPLNPTVCNLAATKTDQIIDVCGSGANQSRKVIRTWTILDWCTAATTVFTQVIKAEDFEGPTITCPADLTLATDPWVCAVTTTLPLPEHLFDNCYGEVHYYVSIDGVENDPLNLPPGAPGNVNPNDQIGGDAATGYIIYDLPKGVHEVVYTAEDECGNQSSCSFFVTVLDETPPVAVAKLNIIISLTSGATSGDGVAKLFAQSVDNGSSDGCGPVHLEIRREISPLCDNPGNITYNNDGHPQDSPLDPDQGAWVKFCCADFDENGVDEDGDGMVDYALVPVWLRVWDDGDMNGIFGSAGDNFNETWVNVRVEDKIVPAINCPPDITINCDMDPEDYSIVGMAHAYGNCGPKNVDKIDVSDSRDACGVGVIRRRWFVDMDGNGAQDPGTPFCEQFITVEAVEPFNESHITWPKHYTRLDFALPSDSLAFSCIPGTTQEPDWEDIPCSQVGVSVDEQILEFEDGACFKILKHWTIIDWCQYEPNASAPTGIWQFTQVIKVVDDAAPEFEGCDDVTFWATEDCLAQDVEITNVAIDNGDCPSDWLKWEICLDLYADWTCDYIWTSFGNPSANPFDNVFYIPPSASGEEVTIPDEPDTPFDLAELDLAVGTHRVSYKVNDGCSNVRQCEKIVTVEDGKAPTPYCIQNISTAVMGHEPGEGGMIDIWAIDFDLGSLDNCTAQEDLCFTFTETPPEADPNYDEALHSSYMRFTCDDLTNGTTLVELSMYVWDEAGLRDHCTVFLRIQDNHGFCGTGVTSGMIAGRVSSEAGEGMSDVEMELNALLAEYPLSQMTNQGIYAFSDNPMYFSYEVSAVKNDNYLNGVSTLDLVLIQKHILGLTPFNNPYKVIAADINGDEGVSAIDLVQLRKLILGIIDELPNNESWRFVDAAQTFDDVNDPFPFTEVIDIADLDSDMMHNDLIGVKIGDVSGDALANFGDSNDASVKSRLALQTAEQHFAKGDRVRVDVRSAQFNDVYGYQFTMHTAGLQFAGVESGALEMTTDNLGLHRLEEGLISVSWADAHGANVASDQPLFTLIFDATDNGQLSQALQIGSAITRAEAYVSKALVVRHIGLTFEGSEVIDQTSEFALYQNEPNPFAETSVIGFDLPNAGEASISIFDVTGKVVTRIDGHFAKGYNEVQVHRDALSAAGVLYYQLESGDFTATKKMIILK